MIGSAKDLFLLGGLGTGLWLRATEISLRFPNILRSLSLKFFRHFLRQFTYIIFDTSYQFVFYLWRLKPALKLLKIPKDYVSDCSVFLFCSSMWVDQKQPLEVFYKKAVLKNFTIFRPYKETPAQVFSCEYCKFSKNISFEEHMGTAPSSGFVSFIHWVITSD